MSEKDEEFEKPWTCDKVVPSRYHKHKYTFFRVEGYGSDGPIGMDKRCEYADICPDSDDCSNGRPFGRHGENK